MRDEWMDVRVGVGEPPSRTVSAEICQALKNLVFERALDAGQRAELAGFRRRLQGLQRRDAERVVDLLRALRTEARYLEHLHQALRRLRRQLSQERQRARLENRADLAGEVAPDAREFVEATFCRYRRRGYAERLNRSRGGPVGAHPELILALDLEEVGDFLENARDVDVLDRRVRTHRWSGGDASGRCFGHGRYPDGAT